MNAGSVLYSDADQFILPAPEANFLGMGQPGFPLRVGMVQVEVFVIGILVPEQLDVLIQTAALTNRRFVGKIDTGLIQCNRIEGGQHPDIRDDGNVVFAVTVTEGRNITDQRDMEAGAGASLYHGIGVFCNFAGEDLCRVGIAGFDGVLGTCGETAAAADTFAVIDMGLAVFNAGAVMRTDTYA